MTRLDTVPSHLSASPTAQPDPARVATVAELRALREVRVMSKYGAVPTVVENIRFASKREAERYKELRLLETAGEISDIKCQVRFVLSVRDRNGDAQPISAYIADFTYRNKSGFIVIEDAKGVKTPMYNLKKKWFKTEWGLDIQEV